MSHNRFDIGCNDWSQVNIILFAWSDNQLESGKFCNRKLHEIFDRDDPAGAVQFTVRGVRNVKVKMYQEHVHAMKSMLKIHTLEDMPKTVGTCRNRLRDAETLKNKFEDPEAFRNQFVGTRVEVTITSCNTLRGARERACKLDFLRVKGFERPEFGGPFMKEQITRSEWVDNLTYAINEMASLLNGRNERRVSLKMKHALTYLRTMMGWCGKHGRQRLADMRYYNDHLEANDVIDDAVRAGRLDDVLDRLDEMVENSEISDEKADLVEEMVEEIAAMKQQIRWRRPRNGTGFMVTKKGRGHPLKGRWAHKDAACQELYERYGDTWRDEIAHDSD